MAKVKRRMGISTIILLLLWAAGLCFGYWGVSTGWHQQNAIMKFCSTYNDTSLGWFAYVFGHGVLNFFAGYVELYFAASPIIFLIAFAINEWNIHAALVRLFTTVITSAFAVAITAMIIYSGMYMMEQHPLLSGLVILCGILAGLASCCTLVQIVIVVE